MLCQHVLRGVVLHLKAIELFSGSMMKSGEERKRISNKFTHFQRKNRSAGRKLVEEFARRYGLHPDYYTWDEIERVVGVSFMIFDRLGYLSYCSSELRETNCVFYEGKKGLYLVRGKFLKAFGS